MDIYSTLGSDLQAAYERLTSDLQRIARDNGQPCFPEDDDLVQTRLHTAAARCGAAIGAAVKREKSYLLMNALLQAQQTEDLDITPAVAQGMAKEILDRGLSKKMTAKLFSTPGRTAAKKTNVTQDDLKELVDNLKTQLGELMKKIELAKYEANDKWHSSQGRSDVLADWSEQRRAQLRDEFKFDKGFM